MGAPQTQKLNVSAFTRTLLDEVDQAAWQAALGISGGSFQPLDAELTALAGLTSAADRLPYFTGSGSASLATFTAFSRTLLDDADAATWRATLGVPLTAFPAFTLASGANIALNGNYLSGDGGNEGVFVDGSGNVAVGHASPGRKFHVVDNAAVPARFGRDSTSSAANHVEMVNNDTTDGNSATFSFHTTTTGAGATANLTMAGIRALFTTHDHATRVAELVFLTSSAGSATERWRINGPGDLLGQNASQLGWADALLVRDAAAQIGLRNGTTAQAFAVYNTSSSSNANYERLRYHWASNVATISTENAGTGSARAICFAPGSGQFFMGTNGAGGIQFFPFNNLTNATPAPAGLAMGFYSPLTSHANDWYAFSFTGTSITKTASTFSDMFLGRPFAPTSGTATYTELLLQPTINQTGGANGITRGLYINPTLTAAADWRPLEIAGAGSITLNGALNFVLDTTTGTKIGTATGQKLGFWNATPVVQQVLATGGGATVDNVITLLQTLGLCKQS